jgi:very-short-patch-repair endonuclease
MAAILRGGPSAMASHRCAAALWQLDGIKERPVELSVKAGRRIRGAVVHRRRGSDDPPVVLFEGIPTTDVERTLLDLAGVITAPRLALALEDALRRGSTALDAMREMVRGQRGRTGLPTLRRLIEARDHRDALAESRLESELLRLLSGYALPLPVAQYRVMDGAGLVARLDFAYPDHRLGVETDGYRWHGGLERWKRDLRRENRLKLLGWTVLHFSWEDVHDRPDLVANQIRAALDHASPNVSR